MHYPQRCLIYLIKNKLNTKIYVGQTWTTTEKRWKYGYHRQPHIWNAIQKYGRENFYYEELLCCLTQEEADHREQYFILLYQSNDRNFGYNIASGGSRGRMSEETKIKLSKAKKGKPGRKQSLENRSRISQSLKGRSISEATKKKIGDANSRH
jgi:group I intron endonuclease